MQRGRKRTAGTGAGSARLMAYAFFVLSVASAHAVANASREKERSRGAIRRGCHGKTESHGPIPLDKGLRWEIIDALRARVAAVVSRDRASVDPCTRIGGSDVLIRGCGGKSARSLARCRLLRDLLPICRKRKQARGVDASNL